MVTLTEPQKISDLTVGQFKNLIRETFLELIDPDYGLELKPEVEESLRKSMKQRERGEGIPLEEVKRKLGLE